MRMAGLPFDIAVSVTSCCTQQQKGGVPMRYPRWLNILAFVVVILVSYYVFPFHFPRPNPCLSCPPPDTDVFRWVAGGVTVLIGLGGLVGQFAARGGYPVPADWRP